MAKDDFKVKKGLVVGKGIVADSAVTASAFIGDGSQLTNLDYNDITSNLPNILDSGNVSSLIDSADTHDSAAVLGQITSTVDSDYIELRRPAESVFDLSGSANPNYAFTGDGFPASANNPDLYLTRGKTYKFTGISSYHPLQIRTSAGGSAYNSGVTNNGESGTVIFTVPMDAPTSLVYQCTVHSGMVGNIYIDKVVGVDSAAVNSLISAADTHDSAAIQAQIDSAVTISFINGLSGTLDADTLGGNDSNYFTNAANLTGTIDSARIPILILGTDTNGNYVQSTTAGLGIKSLSAAGEGVDQTIAVDSGFVTGLFSASEGISYSGGVIGLDATDSATFANVTVTNEFAIFDSANGEEVAKFEGDPTNGLVIHSHAHATDGGIRFVIHDGADSDYLILSQPTGISAVNRRIRNVGTPTADADAATKSYVDAVAEGLHVHEATRVATTQTLVSDAKVSTVTYDSGTSGVGAFFAITGSLDSIDGVTLVTNDRILVKDETNQANNGIYVWDSATRITRATDFDTAAEIAGGDFVFTTEGTTNASAGFVQTQPHTQPPGDSAIVFQQFSGAGQITAGNGISKTGNTLAVDLASSSGLTATGGGGSQLSIKQASAGDYNTLELTTDGIRVSQQADHGIGIPELNFEDGTNGITLARILSSTTETFATAALRNQLESGIYKVYTSAIGDSDTRALVDSDYVRLRADSDYIKTVTGFTNSNLTSSSVTVTAGKGLLNGGEVSLGGTITINIDSANIQGFTVDSSEVTNMIDSAYIRPLARAAIVAGSNITYDSATGVIASTASGGGDGASSSFTVALSLLDSTTRAGTGITSALGVGDPVFYDSDAGYWTGAKADSASTASHIIVEFSTSNSNFKIAQTGIFTLDSNSGSPTFSDNSYYYLSDSSGVPTPTQPTTGIFQALYYALDSDTIDINLGDPVEIGIGKTDIEQFPNVVGGNTTLSLTQSINTARTDVYKNGILLQEGATSDYVITSSTQITLNDAPDDSDVFSVRSMVPVGTVNTATTVITGSTAGAPNPAVQGDTNTGLFSATADTLSITTGGSERLKATNTGVEVTGTLTASTISGVSTLSGISTINGGPTIDSATISGDLTLTGGPGIPNVATLSDVALPSSTTYYIDSGNVAKLITSDSAEIHINTHDANFANYIGTSFSIMVQNNGSSVIDIVTKAGKSGDTVFFNSSNSVTISASQLAVISGMVFDADNLLINSIHLDSDITT